MNLLPRRDVPEWLSKLDDTQVLPLSQLLEESLYYPASGRDGDPVRYFGGHIHSFIYVDYGFEREEILKSLNDKHHGFKGYSIIHMRDVNKHELVPRSWTPEVARLAEESRQYSPWVKTPFALWCIFQRDAHNDDAHGPKRFSLLYVCGDGVATFQALYKANRKSPEVVAIIQPGTGFGGNWTDFRDQNKIFARSVLENPAGQPEYLLYGGWGGGYSECCWSMYADLIANWKMSGGELGLWKRINPVVR